MKKFRRIRFGDSKNWVLSYPQNKTLLFASDIGGYWCKEHRKGMSRIQAVISHYKHSHNGRKISDIIEFQNPNIHDKSVEKVSTDIQRERKSPKINFFEGMGLKSNSRDRFRNSNLSADNMFKNFNLSDKPKKEWWVEDPKKTREEIESKISSYELVKRAKDAGMPKQELDLIKIRLGIASTDTDDESKILKEWVIKKLLDKQ